jgi:hypothetical protein
MWTQIEFLVFAFLLIVILVLVAPTAKIALFVISFVGYFLLIASYMRDISVELRKEANPGLYTAPVHSAWMESGLAPPRFPYGGEGFAAPPGPSELPPAGADEDAVGYLTGTAKRAYVSHDNRTSLQQMKDIYSDQLDAEDHAHWWDDSGSYPGVYY